MAKDFLKVRTDEASLRLHDGILATYAGTLGVGDENGNRAMQEILERIQQGLGTGDGSQSEDEYMSDPDAKPDEEAMRALTGGNVVTINGPDGNPIQVRQASPLGFQRVRRIDNGKQEG